MIADLDADWPELREPYDAAARSPALAARLSAILPARPRILDLADDTGSMLRWLAPRLGRAQAWMLADADADRVTAAFERTAEWAERRGWTVTWPGRAMLVHTPAGAWRIEGMAVDLAETPAGLPLDATDAVVCSAFLGLVSRAWLNGLAAGLRTPLLASLDADARDAWLPRHAADRLIGIGLRHRSASDLGSGTRLGARAPLAAMHALAHRGLAVASAPSDWRVPAGALAMTRRLVQAAAEAARAALPARRQAIAQWEQVRLRQTLAARLAVRIGHRDILAMPREE